MGQQYSFTMLPNDAQVLALRMFNNMELIAFSVLSKKTFTVAKSLYRKADVRVSIESDVAVTLDTRETHSNTRLTFYENSNPPPTEFHIPNTINVQILSSGHFEALVWENMAMELKSWILHIMELFHHQSSLEEITITSDHRFSLNGIHSLLSDLKVDKLLFVFHLPTTIQAPSLLTPSQSLHFQLGNPFKQSMEIQKMFLQNVPVIHVFEVRNFQLNDLLSCTTKEVVASYVHISAKEMRKWFKLWQNGANPRLESMDFEFYSTAQEINWFAENQAQYKKLTREIYIEYVYEGADVRNGFEIWRKDRRGMAHVVVTSRMSGDRVLCAIRMKVIN